MITETQVKVRTPGFVGVWDRPQPTILKTLTWAHADAPDDPAVTFAFNPQLLARVVKAVGGKTGVRVTVRAEPNKPLHVEPYARSTGVRAVVMPLRSE